MNTWESGRESQMLDAIIDGRKTVEGRLCRGKFAQYAVGDIIKLRRDIRDDSGILQDGKPDAARVEIIAIRRYRTFLEMVSAEGYTKVIPDAKSSAEAAAAYDSYYSLADQTTFGVLAIEVRYLPNASL